MSWQQLAPTLTGTDVTNMSFGLQCAMSNDGTSLVLSSISGDLTNIQQPDIKGLLTYYKLINNVWTVQASAIIQSGLINNLAVSADGSKIVLTYRNLNNQTDLYLITYRYANSQLTKIDEFTLSETDFNYTNLSLSKDGNVFSVGSKVGSGKVFIFSWSSSASVSALFTLLNGESGEGLGANISLSADGSTLAVACSFNSTYTGADKDVGGHIRIYSINISTETVTPIQTITETATGYLNGAKVQLSSDGQMLVVGLPNYNTSRGRIETYFTSGNTFVKSQSVIDGPSNYNMYGYTYTLSGDGQVLVLFKPTTSTQVIQSSFIFYRLNGQSWVNEMTIDNLTLDPKGEDMPLNLNQDSTRFVYSYPVYVPQGWQNTNFSAGAVYSLTYSPQQSIPCFPAGTKVQTTSGPVAVEHLTSRHQILTADGRAVPFKLYKTEITKTTHATAPYTIPAHTFGNNSPAAPLTLSPLHAFQLRPGLWHIPKYAAKQYSTIKQPTIGAPTTYYHIELPNFFTDNIIVEGTVVESFAANQTKGLQNIYKYSHSLQGFTRAHQPLQSKRATSK